MVKKLIASTIFLLFAAPAFSQGNACSSEQINDMVRAAADRHGLRREYVRPNFLPGVTNLLAAEQVVLSERLTRNNVYVLKKTRQLKGNPVPVEEYFEVIPIDGLECNGNAVVGINQTNPETIARKRGAAVAPTEVMAVGLQAYGESALLLGGGLEKMAEESEFGPLLGMLGGTSGSDEARSNVIMTASGSANACWEALGQRGQMHTHIAVRNELRPSEAIKPWESINPLHFMMGPACMAIAMAERLGEDIPEAAAVMWGAQQRALEGAETSIYGAASIDGVPVYQIDIDGLNLTQPTASLGQQPSRYVQHASATYGEQQGAYPSTGRSPSLAQLNPPDHYRSAPSLFLQPRDTTSPAFTGYVPMNALQVSVASSGTSGGSGSMTIHKISLWIDAQNLVRLKMRMEGVMEQDGQSRDVFMENELKDYKTVPGTSLYESYRQILRMGGVMDPSQEAEMQEAVRKLDEYEQQMASMPPSQRAMMENMIGPQMAQMRSMANGGAVEFEIITTSIEINPDLMAAPAGFSTTTSTETTMAPNVVQIVQQHLATLGYDPGNTDGELTKETVVAISKYQATNGMEVTGQATPQLAGVLSAAVDAMN